MFLAHSRQSQREGNGNPLQYSCLENPMDGGAWKAAVHGVAKSQTWLSNFTFTSHFRALEKELATHSSVLALRIPGTEEPGRLPSMGSHRVGHDWSDLAAAAAATHPHKTPMQRQLPTEWKLQLYIGKKCKVFTELNTLFSSANMKQGQYSKWLTL